MAYTFDQIFAADPSNPENVAGGASVTIYAPGDATMTPLTITTPDGGPLANPIPVNSNGFASAFAHATLDRVAWAGGGFTGFFTSYEGLKQVAVDAAQSAADSVALAQAPTDNQVDAGITRANIPAIAAEAVANDPSVASSAATMAQSNAGLIPLWKASTSYTAGQRVVAPNGDIVSAKVTFTSGATYSATNWNPSGQDSRLGAVESNVTNLSVPALSTWFSALANWKTAPAQIIAIGDSITEGSDAGEVRLRWQTRLQKYLREAYGVPSGADYPFIPTMEATSATGMPAVVEGNVTLDTSWGFGWRTGVVRDTGKVTFTFTGTSAAIMYARASATGVMRIVVDSGAPVLVDTNSTTVPPAVDAAMWNTGPLTAGTHTVEVTRDVSSGLNQNPFVEGLLTWNGDETSGIRVIDSAHSGYRSANFATTQCRTTAKALQAAGGAQLAIIAIGTNDTLYPAEFSMYRTNIERMISSLRTNGGFTGSVLLIHWYMTNQVTDDVWAPYGKVLAQIAADDPKVAYLDMRRRMPDMPSPYTDPAGLGYFAGNVHPNARGHKFIADEIAAYLTNGR